jgi:hypothetical protein
MKIEERQEVKKEHPPGQPSSASRTLHWEDHIHFKYFKLKGKFPSPLLTGSGIFEMLQYYQI